MRKGKRGHKELRKVKITRNFIETASGSALIEIGQTRVICSASVEESIPKFLEDTGRGWITAEYSMLPASTTPRRTREIKTGRIDGRAQEIQRLIGRALRTVADFNILGERTIWIDCDVIQADGGTRTAAITGAYIALSDAINLLIKNKILTKNPLKDQVAAVSVGIINGQLLLDLNYEEDSQADVDMNVVMTKKGRLVEVQASAEKKSFSEKELSELLKLAKTGITKLSQIQSTVLRR